MSDVENKLRPSTTAGGHVEDRGQPALPVVHRRFANPSPLGLLSFGTGTVPTAALVRHFPANQSGIFLISSFGVHARGIQTPNVMIAVLIFFGGICQYIVGIMEFVTGNTFGTAVFMSYGAFNISYSMIYLPGSGIIAAYTDKSGALSPDFQQAIAMYIWAWFILTVIYTIAAVRSSWVLFLDLLALDICLILLAAGNMVNSTSVLNAGYAFGYLVAFLSYAIKFFVP
ncbi:FUN34-like transmembrane protein [Fusarium phyllophilum]|uniref:FUN34-like transmembrane protein n=1 Tax=Fusarium phyllophilum TaxID=47803 RepID=A0A8H5NFU0_9HYPO|nr:FUN34-like transmembrane protein [Fusarium phyllophilum]